MPKANLIKRSFSAGQVGKLVWGRTDSPAYENGAGDITNFIVRKHGAVTRRPGTTYVGETKYSARYPTRIKEFVWSNDDAYLIEFGGDYVRFWRDDKILLGGDAKAIIAVQDSSGKILISTVAAHGFTDGDIVAVDGASGSPSPNGRWMAEVVSPQQFIIHNVDGSQFGDPAYNPSMGPAAGFASNTVLELKSPYFLDELQELNFAQSADVMWVTHRNYPVMALTRYSTNMWQFEEWDFEDGPYISRDASKVTIPVIGTENLFGLAELRTPENPFYSGNVVKVRGVTGTTGANGTWENAVGSRGKVRLLGSTYNGDWTGGGVIESTVRFQVTDLVDDVWVQNPGTTLTQNSAGGAGPAGAGFVQGDVNWNIEVLYENEWRLAKIIQVVDAQNVRVQFYNNFVGYIDEKVESRARVSDKQLPLNVGDANIVGIAFNKATRADWMQANAIGTGANQVWNIVTTHAVFTTQDVGKWFRPERITGTYLPAKNPGQADFNWFKITQVTGQSKFDGHRGVGATAGLGTQYSGSIRYNGDNVFVSVRSRTRTCRINADQAYFKATDVGRHVRFMLSGVWSWGKILGVNITTTSNYVVVEYHGEIEVSRSDPTLIYNNGIVDEFRMGAWSATNGYPETVTFHGGRLCFASSGLEPQTFWMSEVNNFRSMRTTKRDGAVTDDLGITFTLSSRELDRIKWMISQRVLLVGTASSEWQIRASSGADDALTPGNVTAQRQSSVGSAGGPTSLVSGSSVIFIQREKQKIMEMTFNWEVNAWKPVEISAHAEGMFAFDIKQIALQQSKDPILWFHDNVNVFGCTFNKDPDVIAFWKVSFINGQGDFYPVGTNRLLFPVSLAVVPRIGGDIQDLYIQVYDSTLYKSYIVKIPAIASSPSPLSLLQSVVSYTDNNVSLPVSGDGVTVLGLGDYFADGDLVLVSQTNTQHLVSGGSITLPESTIQWGAVTIGLPFSSWIETLPMDGGSMFGTSMGKTGRQPKISVRVTPADAFRLYERSDSPVPPVTLLEPGEAFNEDGTDLTTEVSSHYIKSDYREEQSLRIQSIGSRPLTITYIAPQQHIFE